MREPHLSDKVEDAMELWISIPLTDEYFAWLKAVDMPPVSLEDMTDEQADQTIALLEQYKQGLA